MIPGNEHWQFPPVIGIDLGGTQIRVAILQGERMLSRAAMLTGENPTPERVLPRIFATVQQALDEAGMTLPEVSGVGVAAPGPLDYRTGIIYAPPNLPAWRETPLRAILQEHSRKPVYVENDANAAALGEYLFGAGRGCRTMVYLTVSTGIGGGVILAGKLLEGTNGSAGELGHITIDWLGERCSCGNVGCLEALASGTAIARQARQAIARGQGEELLAFARTIAEHPTTLDTGAAQDITSQSLAETAANSRDLDESLSITAQTVAYAAEAGISLARAIIGNAAEALGVGLVNILHTFSPERLILGGGVMHIGKLLFEPAMCIVQERTLWANRTGARILLAQLGENTGLIGAGALPYYYQRDGQQISCT